MLVSDIKSLLQFKSTAIYDDVNQGHLSVYGENKMPQILPGGGYIMQDDQYLLGEGVSLLGYSLAITDSMTMGFWLYSVSPGVSTDETTGAAVPITMPLIDWDEAGSTYSPVIKITENTTSSSGNNLTVSLLDDSYYASSENYLTGVWHYFWIVYDGTVPAISIYVDGKLHTLQNEVGGSPPASLGGGNLDLYINHELDGYSSAVAKNYGYITDLCVFNTVRTSILDMQKVINNGVLYIADTNYNTVQADGFGVYFDDPDTITMTSSIDDMSYVYVGRNDGKIMRGSPLLWEVRRVFSNSDEDSNVNTKTGFLELNNSTIRL